MIRDFALIAKPLEILHEPIPVETILQELVYIEDNFRRLDIMNLKSYHYKHEVTRRQTPFLGLKKKWRSLVVHTTKSMLRSEKSAPFRA